MKLTIRKLAIITGVSPTTIDKYQKILKELSC